MRKMIHTEKKTTPTTQIKQIRNKRNGNKQHRQQRQHTIYSQPSHQHKYCRIEYFNLFSTCILICTTHTFISHVLSIGFWRTWSATKIAHDLQLFQFRCRCCCYGVYVILAAVNDHLNFMNESLTLTLSPLPLYLSPRIILNKNIFHSMKRGVSYPGHIHKHTRIWNPFRSRKCGRS